MFVLTVGLRLVAIDRPLLGNFATKNVVYAMIARNWVEGRATLWYPTLDLIEGGQRSLHMLEMPLSAYLTGWLWATFGGSLEVWGRATSVGFSAGAAMLLFVLVRRHHGPDAALGATVALALAPVGIIYGQSFMLEASLVFFTLATFDALDRWLHGGCLAWLPIGALAFALLLLTKIYMLVLLLPLGAILVGHATRRERDRRVFSSLAFRNGGLRGRAAMAAGLFVLAIVPAVAWYWHAAQTAAPGNPLAERVFYSVRQSAEVHWPPHALLRNADFYRQMLDDLASVALTPVGLMLCLAGLLNRRWRRYAAWLLSMLALVALLPLKFYEMNYYWMAVLPPLCVMIGLGWQTVRQRLRPGPWAKTVLLMLAMVFSLRYAVRPAFVTPKADRAVVAAAAAVRELTEPEEPVVTMHGSGIDLLYYCDRPGWAVQPETPDLDTALATYREQGARYLVVVAEDGDRLGRAPQAPWLAASPPVVRGDGFAVFELGRSGGGPLATSTSP